MAAISRDRAEAGEGRTGPSDPLTQKPRDLLALFGGAWASPKALLGKAQVDSLGSCFSQKLTRLVWGRLWVSAVTEGARREGGAPADGGSAQTPSARSPAPASREPVRPSVQPRLHRLGTRRPRRPPADPARYGAAAAAHLHRLGPRHPPAAPAAGGSRAPPAGGESSGRQEREPRGGTAAARAQGGTAAAAVEGRGHY